MNDDVCLWYRNSIIMQDTSIFNITIYTGRDGGESSFFFSRRRWGGVRSCEKKEYTKERGE